MKSNQRNLLVLAAVAIAGLGVWAIFHFSKTPAFSEMQLYEVKKGTIETKLDEDITLKPVTDVQLSFENGGKIKNILVSVGDQVKKGQLLAEVENKDYIVALHTVSAERDAAAAQLEQAQEDVDIQKAKLQSLKRADAAKYDVKAQKETKDKSQAGVDAQEALLAAAQSQVDEANLQLAKTRLTSPMDGVITDKTIEVGEVTTSGDTVMTMASQSNMEADAFVSELDVKKMTIGDEAQISTSSVDGNMTTIAAKIKNIYPAETIQNGVSSYKVVFELADQDENLKSGLTGTAKINLASETNAIYIPQNSLFSDAGKKYVMVMTGGFPERKDIRVGTYGSDGMVEILSGLSEGDKIINF